MVNPATRTAHGPMLLAAVEDSFPVSQSITRDPLAASLLPLRLRTIAWACRVPWFRDRFIAAIERRHPGGWGGIACRKRCFDEMATAAVAAGVRAVVNLGAGFDTRAVRLPALANLPVFEVDLPENSAEKRLWLARTFGAVPPHLTLVPVDFDRQDVGAALAERGLDPAAPTLYLWEGVTQYLREAGARQTMAALSRAPAGSRLVFTYVRQDYLDGSELFGLGPFRSSRFVQELWHFGLHPDRVDAFLREYGWREQEQLGPAELHARYIAATGRSLQVMAIERTVIASKL